MGYFIDHANLAAIRPSCRDPRGLDGGTSSTQAVAFVETALEAMLSYFGDPLAALDRAIEADPGWAHPHTLKASLLLTMAEYGATLKARDILAAAPSSSQPCEREQAHRAAAEAAARGSWTTACRAWEAILVRWPTDVAALLFAHLFDFYRGDALNLKRRPQRVLPAWAPEMPLYGYVLGMAAFGLEESGQYDEAEDAGRAALAVNPRDPWAVHAVAHVFEMQGRHREGARWLASRQADWAIDNGFSFHQWFHTALFHMEGMDIDAAVAVYDEHLANATDMALQRVDGTAVLWRLKLMGMDVSDRFERLARTWETQAPATGFYAFNDVHALLALIGSDTEESASLEAVVASLAAPASGGSTNHRMSATVGLPLAQALAAYARGDWRAATEGLLGVRDQAHGFGGSHAQRDLLTLTLMDSAARAGDRALAGHVLNERRPAKASTPLTAYWQERIGGR